MALYCVRAETESDARRLAEPLDRDPDIEHDDGDRPFRFLITESEQTTVLQENDGTSVSLAPYDDVTIIDSDSRPARFVNGLTQFFVRREERTKWAINNYSLFAHPWVHLAAVFLEIALLIDLIWLNTFDTLPIMLAFAATWGLHAIFNDPERNKGAKEHVLDWVSKVRSLPFKIPSITDSIAIVVTLALMLAVAITQANVVELLSVTAQSSGAGGGHALTDTINPESPVSIVLLLALFAGFGVAEEVIFRHQIQRVYMSEAGLHRRVWVPGMIFGFAHALVYGVSLNGLTTLVGLGIMGAVMGYSYEITDNLTVPAAAHGLNNILAILGVLIATGAL